jgi:hypothetical protein
MSPLLKKDENPADVKEDITLKMWTKVRVT